MISTNFADLALLPAGFRDILPLQAAHETWLVDRLLQAFHSFGYQRVKPPLVEFEESLFAGSGAPTGKHSFRVMDSQTQKQMGVRSDMTLQVSRIATTRLANLPRPLRLSYAGDVLRIQGAASRPERQFVQAGIELIGIDSAAADAEVIVLVAQSLFDLGISQVSVDLALPTLVPVVVGCLEPDIDMSGLRMALDHKDNMAIAALGGKVGSILCELSNAGGPVDLALPRLKNINLPDEATGLRNRLEDVVNLVKLALPRITLTVDVVENRGFSYHTGVALTFFTPGFSGELGRGGRYQSHGETATGATLYADCLLEVTNPPSSEKKIFLPIGTESVDSKRLRDDGWITIAGLDAGDAMQEAKRLGCDYVFIDKKNVKIVEAGKK